MAKDKKAEAEVSGQKPEVSPELPPPDSQSAIRNPLSIAPLPPDPPPPDPPPFVPPPPATFVEVICEGALGPRLLRKGMRTCDPDYVKLLETERGRRLVKEVRE